MDLLTVFIALSAAVGGFLLKLITSEIRDWLPMIARRIVEHAVSRLPEQGRGRYREEWLSHLEECPGKLGKLLHSIGCCLSARKVASALVNPTLADAVDPTTADAENRNIPDRDLLALIAMLNYLITEFSRIDPISAHSLMSARKSLAQAATESQTRPPEPSK